jgi:hypothetical protein
VRIVHILRKPLAGSVAENILAHGCGALAVDACRLAYEDTPDPATNPLYRKEAGYKVGGGAGFDARKECAGDGEMPVGGVQRPAHELGRWPNNVILEHLPSCQFVGSRRVPGGNDPRASDGTIHRETAMMGAESGGGGFRTATSDHRGFSDDDGLETVEAWECAEGCPVAELDAQTGNRRSAYPGRPDLARDRYGVETNPNDTVGFVYMGSQSGVCYADEGGSSRYFKQVGGGR